MFGVHSRGHSVLVCQFECLSSLSWVAVLLRLHMMWGAQQGSKCDWEADRRASMSGDLQDFPDGNSRMQMISGVVGGTTDRQRESGVLGQSSYH